MRAEANSGAGPNPHAAPESKAEPVTHSAAQPAGEHERQEQQEQEKYRSPAVMPSIDMSKVRSARKRDYAIRFALGATISIGAALITRAVGARFGGMFLAFPAILPASLTLIQEKEGTRRADRNALGAVLGGAALLVFAMIGELALGRIEPYAALMLALLGWIVTAFVLYGLLASVRPDDCDQNKDWDQDGG